MILYIFEPRLAVGCLLLKKGSVFRRLEAIDMQGAEIADLPLLKGIPSWSPNAQLMNGRYTHDPVSKCNRDVTTAIADYGLISKTDPNDVLPIPYVVP